MPSLDAHPFYILPDFRKRCGGKAFLIIFILDVLIYLPYIC